MTELARPNPAAGQVLLQVRACAVCRTDLHILDGELPEPKLQLVLGHEIAGRVEELGQAVERFQPGDLAAQKFARSLGAVWAGDSGTLPPEPLDAAITGRRNQTLQPPDLGWLPRRS